MNQLYTTISQQKEGKSINSCACCESEF